MADTDYRPIIGGCTSSSKYHPSAGANARHPAVNGCDNFASFNAASNAQRELLQNIASMSKSNDNNDDLQK